MPYAAEVAGVPRECTVSVRVAQCLVELVEAKGISRSLLLTAAGLAPELLQTVDVRLPRADIYRLCRHAIELSDDPALGLHWGEHINANALNPLSHLIAHAASLRQGLQALLQYHLLLTDRPSFDLAESGDHVIVRFVGLPGEPVPTQRFVAEVLLTGIFQLVRSFDPQARPMRVNFCYPAPAHGGEYARIFEGTQHFDQAYTGLVFARALMETPSPHRDEDVHVALRTIAERRLLNLTERTPYALRVRELLVKQGPAMQVDMDDVARALGLSARSLRRRLESEGKNFHDVVSEAQAITAKCLLRSTPHSIQEVAYEMGFADASTFHRAFKRWTGTTPRLFRQAEHHLDS